MTGVVKVKLPGVVNPLRVQIGVAPLIEDATGRGILELMDAYFKGKGRVTDTAHVLRIILADNGMPYSVDASLVLVQEAGIAKAMVEASRLLAALFEVPAEAKTKGNGKAAAVAQ